MLADFRLVFRTLRRTPSLALIVVLTLGSGLGLNTALFTLFDNYVLRPFAVKDPYQLYSLGWTTAKGAGGVRLTWDQYQELGAQSTAFTETMAFNQLVAHVETRNLLGMAVTGNYFTSLGAGTAVGRPLLPEDVVPGTRNRIVVIAHSLWQSQFGGDPRVLSRSIQINGNPFVVVGVARPEFTGIAPVPIDFFIPVTAQAEILPGADVFGQDRPAGLFVLGRLRPDLTVNQAQVALSIWLKHLTENLPEEQRSLGAVLTRQATPITFDSEILVVLLPLAVVFGLVLVICCANVSNMMLARALARQREIGVRLAIGAARWRLIRQLLSESLVLALLAGLVGYAVSVGALSGAQRLIIATLPPSFNLMHIGVPQPDYRVFLFILLAAAASTILFGLAPAVQATRNSLTDALRGEFGGMAASSSRLRSALVVSQVAVCMLLIVLTGVLVRVSTGYQQRDPGFQSAGIVYPIFIGGVVDNAGTVKLVKALANEPWVETLAPAWHPPLRAQSQIPVSAASVGASAVVRSSFNYVSAEFFGILGIPVTRGRNFQRAEMETEAPVAILSQGAAQKLFPNEDAIGKSILLDRRAVARTDAPGFDQAVVVGIAKDVASGQVVFGPDAAMVYLPTAASKPNRSYTVLIRGRGSVSATIHELEKTLAAVVPDRPVISTSLEEILGVQVYPFLAAAWVAALLGGLALLLTLSGMYGVLSYLVGQRTKEIGVRIAIGASPGDIVRLVVMQSMRYAGMGAVVGIGLALGCALVLRHYLRAIDAFGLLPYAAGVVVIGLAAVVAALVPSRRAAGVNPLDALRVD